MGDGLADEGVGVRHSAAILADMRQVNESYRFVLETKANLGQCLVNELTAEVKHRFFHPISLRLRKGLVAFGPTAN